jgi:hypothetical protein
MIFLNVGLSLIQDSHFLFNIDTALGPVLIEIVGLTSHKFVGNILQLMLY